MAFSGTANAFNLPNIKGNTGTDVSIVNIVLPGTRLLRELNS